MGNLGIAQAGGCLVGKGTNDLRHGRAPTIQRGPGKGDELSVDHIIPLKLAPGLDKEIANLKLAPLRANESKKAKVDAQGLALAQRLHALGRLDDAGLAAVADAANGKRGGK